MSSTMPPEATTTAMSVDLERGESTLTPPFQHLDVLSYPVPSEMSLSASNVSGCSKPEKVPSKPTIVERASRSCQSAFCGTNKRFKYTACCISAVVVGTALSVGLIFGLRHTLNKDPTAVQMRCGAGSAWTNATEAVEDSHFSIPGAVACSSNDLGYHLGDGSYGEKVWDDDTSVFVTNDVDGERLSPGWGVNWRAVDPAAELQVLGWVDDKGEVTWAERN